MRVAIIPARGGSKRIPRKNIREFCGKPIIAWSIKAALESCCFDWVIVSTDDDEIASIARQYGAATPFKRPAELSDDYTGTTLVIRHAIEWFMAQGEQPDQVCCIYATAPFLVPDDLLLSLQKLKDSDKDYVFAVTKYAFPIQRAIRMTPSGNVEMFYPEHFYARSQDLEEVYHDAGQFYWGRAQAWLEERQLFTSASVGYVLPQHRVQDIDVEEDWIRAEAMFQVLRDAR
ncbi:pseudaminic acid cytidylyltransferase [Alphaproteobacteria bacterium LSUCC0719]